MKKEYKTPLVNIVNVDVEIPILSKSTEPEQGNIVESKRSGRTFEDDEAMPAAPKKFWDDEE